MNKMEKVYAWWSSLTDEKQYNLMNEWYPTEVNKVIDIDKFFGDMPNKYQLEIYEEEVKK